MANQPLAFAALIGAGLLGVAAIKDQTIRGTVKGTDKPGAGSGSDPLTTLLSASGTPAPGGGTPAPAGGGTGAPGASGLTVGGMKTLRSLATSHGWSGGQIPAWLQVISRESGGDPTIKNPGSNAYGIAQFIDGPSEYYQWGGDPNTVPGQLTAMANYIASRYGTPAVAWNHEINYGWY